MAKKKRKRPFHPTYHFRMTYARRELLARRAFKNNIPHQSIQLELEREVFGPESENELEVLRADQRRAGIPDSKFLHARQLISMGRKARYGRRKQIVPPQSENSLGARPQVGSVD